MLSNVEMAKFFARMTHLWGHKWTSVYGASAVDAKGDLLPSAAQWRYDLRDYTREQLSFGIEQAVGKRLEWPPGPVELMSLCDGIPSMEEILDTRHDYGPVCKMIRQQMDWFLLDGMPSDKRRKAGRVFAEHAITSLRRDGSIQRAAAALVAEKREALT